VVLDATVFYPQGGGQPADTGAITGAGAKFLVEDVRAKDGVVRGRAFLFLEEELHTCSGDFVAGVLNFTCHDSFIL
jgi:Ser-tRNA(Ala) deacylase AlaX